MPALGTVSVRGKQVGTRIYALLGDRSAAETTAFRHLLARHAELMAALDARDRARCGAVAPADGLFLMQVDY